MTHATTNQDRPAVPSTFADYMREHDIPADHPNLEGWRVLWQRDQQAEQQKPTTIPPCPAWCRLPEGHDYSEVDGFRDELTFERQHVAFEGKAADVQATEHNRSGEVTVDALEIYLDLRDDSYPPSVVRALAAELVEAADLLERLLEGGA
jgi:hypothetical protein